ncbi:MAG: DUF4861 family protein, partial [Bacteroidota bacterium]
LYRVKGSPAASYELLYTGRYQSAFQLNFPEVEVGDKSVAVEQIIRITAGMSGYESEVTVSPKLAGLSFAAGIVNLESDTFYTETTDQLAILYTHDQQAFLGEYLGMAVICPKAQFIQNHTAPEAGSGIIQTFASLQEFDEKGKAKHLFAAGWEKKKVDFAEREKFLQQLIIDGAKWQRLW